MPTASLPDALLRAVQPGGDRIAIGTVTSVDLSSNTCTVVRSGTELVAAMADQTVDWVTIGSQVVLVTIGDTHLVGWTIGGNNGGSGGVGASYGPNLLANPSFEYGEGEATSWTSSPYLAGMATAERDTTSPTVEGSASLSQTVKAGDVAPEAGSLSAAFSVDTGKTYRVDAWTRASALDADLTVRMTVVSAPTAGTCRPGMLGAVETELAALVSPGGAFQYVTSPWTVPAGRKYAAVYLQATSSSPTTPDLTAWWDSVGVRQQVS